jgi:hypothetical protein
MLCWYWYYFKKWVLIFWFYSTLSMPVKGKFSSWQIQNSVGILIVVAGSLNRKVWNATWTIIFHFGQNSVGILIVVAGSLNRKVWNATCTIIFHFGHKEFRLDPALLGGFSTGMALNTVKMHFNTQVLLINFNLQKLRGTTHNEWETASGILAICLWCH